MDSDRMTAERSYRPLPTEKLIPRQVQRKYRPTFHLAMQMNQMDLDEITANENNNEQANDNKTGGQQNNQGSNNEDQLEPDNGNTKLGEIGSSHTTHFEQELRNPNIQQPNSQLPLNITPPELSQVKGKVVVPKQMMKPTNEHDTRSKTGQLKSVLNKSFGSLEARANSDTLNHFVPQQGRRKKADVASFIEDQSAKHPKGNKTSAGSK
ncbi:MAG: hypothetical protein EZS28_050836, partial [Streblomastix strix]